MKKLLILANSSVGLYSFRNELILELVKKYEVIVSLPDDTNVDILEAEGCTIIKTDINRRGINPVQDMKLFFTYLKLLKEIKPDAVLTYTIKPNVYGGLACGIRRVPFMANITGLGAALENPGIIQKVAIMLYRIGLRKADTVFVQNTSNQQFVEGNKMAKNTVLLPGSGVNTEKFSKLSWPDKNAFIFVSRIMREKGIDEYFECAKAIRKDYPDIEFHVLGPYEENYEEQLNQLHKDGVINYHGSVKDVRPYLEQVRCIVHPSLNEGMSNVCLEAAASGRAIITIDRPGCRETVIDKETGFVAPHQDKDEVLELVRRFVNMSSEEQKAMGDAGREFVVKNFDRQIVVDTYMGRLAQIMGE